jgi:two-component system OmpR family sensor kinase
VPVDLQPLLADAVLDASATHPSRQVTLDAGSDLVVAGDDAPLRQVFANLLGNALKYAGDGATIAITARRHGDICSVDVADDGAGMTADEVAHAFDRFWRADSSRVHNHSGAGLGLSIVRAIVEAHRGTITIDSAPSKGTRVIVTLPVWADLQETRR